jgi:hypothetical protein
MCTEVVEKEKMFNSRDGHGRLEINGGQINRKIYISRKDQQGCKKNRGKVLILASLIKIKSVPTL